MRSDSVGCKLHFSRIGLTGLAVFAALAFAIASAVNGAAPPAAAQSAAPAAQSGAAPAASTTDIVGIWQGTLHAGRDLRTELKITKAGDGSFKAAFYSIDQGGQPFVASKTTFQDGTLSFALDAIGGKYEGKMSPDGKTISGTWTQGPTPIALNLERTAEDAAWPIPEPIRPMVADAHPSFDVATIKPSQPGARGKGFGFNGHFRTFNFDVNDMIAIGFGLHTKQIIGAPDWLATDLYDIDAVPNVPGRPNIKQMGDILQALLVDRFALKFHREQRELPVYAIQLAPGGPKMKATTAGPNDPQGFGFRGLGDLAVINMSMKDFAFGMQSAVTDRPVVDQTGLTGRYDFTLKWTPDDSQFAQFRGAVPPQPPAAGDNPNAPPSLYTAVQEQLGLKITATKAPDDVIVIDHIEKPSPN
ncbi:MAG: TIGR03435 family protein [Terracidiphilus sp.]